MKKTLVAVALVMLMAASAQAGMVGINLSSNAAGSTVSSSYSEGSQAQQNWNNWNLDTGTWVSSPTNAAGGSIPSGLSVSWSNGGGGWGGQFSGTGQWGGVIGAAGTLGYTLVSSEYSLKVTLSNIPASWGTFTVAYYTKAYPQEGAYAWFEQTGVTGTTYVSPTNWPGNDGRGGGAVSAIQIYGPNVPSNAIPEPATMSLLVIGGIATLIRRRNRRA